ncbi:MAG: transcriptional regulator [Rickettsiales bacterium]|nr:transcriptional regulator [Rickettsiales bacterium]|tara:strand:+ start:2569 stop:3246 length:678 start_codon:yes stop_codon:yes gene_type:complete
MSLLAQSRAVFLKDLLLAARGGSRLSGVLFFATMTLLLFSFATEPDPESMRRHAAGYLWLALLLSSLLSLGESFRAEVEDEALEGLRLLPVDPRALFYGKALSNTLFLVGLSLVLLPLSLGLFGAEVKSSPGLLLAFLLLGTAGLAAPGSLYAAMTSRARGQDLLLPLLLFPLVVPVLIASVKGTGLCFSADPMDQRGALLQVLTVFDLIYWSVCGLLFGKVIEE